MSNTLFWRPAPKDVPPGHALPYELKRAISKRIWDHDGSLNGDEELLGKTWLNYLDGLADGGVPGAEELADAIRVHEVVLVWLEG